MKKLLGVFVFLFAFGLTGRADATILWAGGEEVDFLRLVGTGETQTSHDGRFARNAIITGNICWGNGDPANSQIPPAYALTPTFTSTSSFWVHGLMVDGYYMDFAPDTLCDQNGWELIALFSPDGYPRIAVGYPSGQTGAIDQYSIYKIDNTGAYTLLATQTADPTNLICGTDTTTFDLYVNYSASGTVTLYCNGVQAVTYSGNVTTNSTTTLNQVRFAGFGSWSEMIVSTTPTPAMHLLSLIPAASGNADTFTTGNVSNINDNSLDTTTVDASGTAGQIQEYTVLPPGWDWGNFSSSANSNVLAVVTHASALVNSTGPQHLQAMVRTGGADYTSSNLSPNQYSWTHISNIWATNPNTSANWTLGDLMNAGFNIGFKSAN